MKKISFILLFIILSGNLLISTFTYAQHTKKDSLLSVLKKDKLNKSSSGNISGEDTNKIKLLNDLSWEYYRCFKTDSALHYGNASLELATTILNSTKNKTNPSKSDLIIQQTAQKGITASCQSIGNIHEEQGDPTKALEYYFKALKASEEIGHKKEIARTYNYIGSVYHAQANYPQALDYYFKALKIDEEIENKKGIAVRYTNIGNVYNLQADYAKALDYFFKSLKINKEIDRKNSIAINYANIGSVYHKQTNYTKALEYYFEALEMFEKQKNGNGRAAALGNIGSAYKDRAELLNTTGLNKDSVRDDYYKALDYYLKALKIDEKLGNKSSIVIRLVNIGGLWTSLEKYNEAYTNIYKALAISDSIGSMSTTKESYEQLSRLYEKSTISLPDSIGGRMLNKEEMRLKALYYFKNYMNVRDSLFSEENQKQLIQKEMNFDFEKKEAATKAEQVKKDVITKEELKQKEQQRNYFIIGFILVALLSVFIFRGYKQKQKANEIISEQKSLVEEKQKEILDSIHYAKRIQRSLLPTEKYIERSLKKLKDKDYKS